MRKMYCTYSVWSLFTYIYQQLSPVRLQKFVVSFTVCIFPLQRFVVSTFFHYKVCSVHIFQLQKFVLLPCNVLNSVQVHGDIVQCFRAVNFSQTAIHLYTPQKIVAKTDQGKGLEWKLIMKQKLGQPTVKISAEIYEKKVDCDQKITWLVGQYQSFPIVHLHMISGKGLNCLTCQCRALSLWYGVSPHGMTHGMV